MHSNFYLKVNLKAEHNENECRTEKQTNKKQQGLYSIRFKDTKRKKLGTLTLNFEF